MDKIVLVRVEKCFGRMLYYPANDLAQRFVELVHAKKALSDDEIKIIKALGYTVQAITPEV